MENKLFKGKLKWDLGWTDIIVIFIILLLWLQAREYRQGYIDCIKSKGNPSFEFTVNKPIVSNTSNFITNDTSKVYINTTSQKLPT